jgi:hypothetical protein
VVQDAPGAVIQVVLVDVPTSVADHLETIADCFSLEIAFRDCSEVLGRASSRSGTCGRTSGHSTFAGGSSRFPIRTCGAARRLEVVGVASAQRVGRFDGEGRG